METVHKWEKTIAGWYKGAPHLPKGGQKWLADNVWWLAVIGAVLGALGAFGVLGTTLFLGSVLTGLGFAYGGVAGVTAAGLAGVAFIVVLISIAVLVIQTVLLAMAVSPLKVHKKRGWDLLFITALVGVASVVISNVLSFNLPGLVWGLLWAAVGAYFLFEIHGYFGEKVKAGDKAKNAKK